MRLYDLVYVNRQVHQGCAYMCLPEEMYMKRVLDSECVQFSLYLKYVHMSVERGSHVGPHHQSQPCLSRPRRSPR